VLGEAGEGSGSHTQYMELYFPIGNQLHFSRGKDVQNQRFRKIPMLDSITERTGGRGK
jgi:hypothetical protein